MSDAVREAVASPSPPAPPYPGSSPPPMAPAELHRYLVRIHRQRNRLDWRFFQGLLALDEGQIYGPLGYPSSQSYAQQHFGMGRTAHFEALRVAGALRRLPETELAYKNGLAYTRVKEITRVASAETERDWLALSEELSIRKLKVEVKDALAKKRKRPRAKKDLYSLPAQRLKLPFDFAPEEYELVDQALRKVGKELSLSLGGEEVDLKAALLYWLKRALETDPASTPEGRIEREESVYTVLYHRCRDCHRSHVMTDEGPVDVPAEAVERVEGTAETVEIRPEEEVPPAAGAETAAADQDTGQDSPPVARDRQHTPEFLRKLFLRDGGRCVNPLCGRKLHLNGHHLKPWSQGGRTALWNEATLCVACHAAVEQGLLKVTGDPLGGFTFTTRADEIGLELAEEGRAIDNLPLVTVQSTYVNGSRPTDQSTYLNGSTQVNQSTQVDGPSTPEETELFETCAAALRSLGSRRDSALRATERAFAKLRAAGQPIGEEALIKAALARSPR